VLNYSSYLYKSAKVPENTTLAAQAIYSVIILAIKAAGERKAKAAIAKEQANFGSGKAHAQGA
jgi:hypothetical protein